MLSTFHQRFTHVRLSSAHLTGLSRLFLNAHYPGRWARAASGGLDPGPAARVRGADPHLLCSSAAFRWPSGLLSAPSWRTIVSITLEWDAREILLHPQIERIMQEEIGEQRTRYSSYTIDTFSLSIVLSLSKHPLYASGRKYAVYRWRTSAPDQKASNLVQPEVTHYGKEEAAPSVDSASGTGLSPRSRRADRQSLRTRPANHSIKASPKNRRGGKSK